MAAQVPQGLIPVGKGHHPTQLHLASHTCVSVGMRFSHRLLPYSSPLLRESLLFSCPALMDMLELRAYPCTHEEDTTVSE